MFFHSIVVCRFVKGVLWPFSFNWIVLEIRAVVNYAPSWSAIKLTVCKDFLMKKN